MILFHRKSSASADFACGPDILYEILTDYDSYKEWMPDVTESALLAKEGELAIASLDFGSGDSRRVALECIHTTNRGVLSRAIEGETLIKSLDWSIEAAGGGARLTLVVEAPVQAAISGGGGLPGPKEMLEGLRAFASAFSDSGAAPDAQTVIEIVETEKGLVCWFNGRQYEMKPVVK
jgi:ribosome-associated toxin RatA of RatAB toxin-antitoxin module